MNPHSDFHSVCAVFYFQPIVNKYSPFPSSMPALVVVCGLFFVYLFYFVLGFISGILTGAKWNFKVVLIWTYLMAKDADRFKTCLSAICVSSFENLFSFMLIFLKIVLFVFLMFYLLSSVYISESSPLSDEPIKNFSHFKGSILWKVLWSYSEYSKLHILKV